jgi:hypothetical protein
MLQDADVADLLFFDASSARPQGCGPRSTKFFSGIS